MKVKTIWDLELLEFKLVAPTFLLESPCITYGHVNQIKHERTIILSHVKQWIMPIYSLQEEKQASQKVLHTLMRICVTSSKLVTYSSVKFSTYKPFFASSLIWNNFLPNPLLQSSISDTSKNIKDSKSPPQGFAEWGLVNPQFVRYISVDKQIN